LNGYLRVAQFFLRYRRFIVWAVALSTVGVAVFSLVTPARYRSTAQVLPPSEDQDLFSAGSLAQSTSLSRMLRMGGTLRGGTTSDLVAALFRSRTVQERVLELCNYRAEYKIREKGIEGQLKMLDKATLVTTGDEGIIRVSVEAKRPDLAAKMVNTYVAEVDRVLRESNMSRSHSVRVFIEGRLAQTDSELTAASDSLVQFQNRNQLVSLDEETKAAVESYAKLKAQEMSYDFESKVADRVLQPDNPYAQQLQTQAKQMRRQLSSFETGSGLPGYGIGSAVPLHRLPEVASRYVELLTNYKLKEELRSLLVAQYEDARIKEVRDTPAISVLDEGKKPERRSYPKRTRMTLTAFFASLFLAVCLSAAFDGIRAGVRVGLEKPESAGFVARFSVESKLMARFFAFLAGEPHRTSDPKLPHSENRRA
jgi:capsule polysaccharide export protein KpsE/RkpR